VLTHKLYRALGIISIVIGVIAVALIFFPKWIPLAMPLVILGFAAAGGNIYLNNKYEFDEQKWPLGYIGMFINSLPIVFLLILIFKYK
jgi:hypothetical protein